MKVLRIIREYLNRGAAALCLVGLLCLPPGAQAASPPVGSFITNQARVDYSDVNGNVMPAEIATAQTQVSGSPVLTITKLESSDPVSMGGDLTYTIVYENTGNTLASGVVIQDELSRHVTFVNASDGGAFTPDPSGFGGVVVWSLPDLAPYAQGLLTLNVKVRTPGDYPPGDPDPIQSGSLIYNTASIDSNETSGSRTIITTVGQGSNLLISKKADVSIASPGGEISYVISYENHGNQFASGVQVRDELPLGVALVPGSISHGWVFQGRTLIWDLGVLQPGDKGTLLFSVKVSQLAQENSIILNRAVITSMEKGPVPSNDVNVRILSQTSFGLSKTAPANVKAGEEIAYVLKVINDGLTRIEGVKVSDPLPSGVSFVSADNGGVLTAGAVQWDLGDMNPGQETVLNLVTRADDLGQNQQVILNTARASADGLNPVEASASTAITCRTKGVLSFLDFSGNKAARYLVGDDICVQLEDAERNTDSGVQESVVATIESHDPGDQESVILWETDPATGAPSTDSGVFRACIPSDASSPGSSGNGVLSIASDGEIVVKYADPLDPLCGLPAEEVASILIDPYGIVFDSATGDPVKGAIVSLFTSAGALAGTLPAWPAGQADVVTTGPDGAFAFPLVPPGDFYLAVNPGQDYSFPTALTNAQLPPGFAVTLGSRGETFTLSDPLTPLNVDIPVDPDSGELSVSKTADKTIASIGDFIVYEIRIVNRGASSATDLTIHDYLPHGVDYKKGSSRLDGKYIPDPVFEGDRELVWSLENLEPGSELVLTYKVVLGPESSQGDGKNTAAAHATSLGKTISSNRASHTIQITEGVFTSEGTIIGKVFFDRINDGVQKPDESNGEREPGIKGAVIFMEDGTRVETDPNGKFSIVGVKPGTHVLRLDKTTLPPQYEPVSISNRFMGSSTSRFVDMPQGGLVKANFGVVLKKGASFMEKSASQARDVSSGPDEDPKESLETLIKNLESKFAILIPEDDQIISKDKTKIVIQAPLGAVVSAAVNGSPLRPDQLGATVTNKKNRVILLEYVGVELQAGKENTIQVQYKDPFGNVRGDKTIKVRSTGAPASIVISKESSEIFADGRTPAHFSVQLLDAGGLAVSHSSMATISVKGAEITEDDLDEKTPGVQIPYKNGRAGFTIMSPARAGPVKITAQCEGLTKEKEFFFKPHLRDMIAVGMGEIVIGKGDAKGDAHYLKKKNALKDDVYSDARGAVFLKGKVPGDALLTVAFDSAKDREDNEHDVFESRKKDYDSEDKYPVYGDESKTTYEAQSREKLYAKLEKGESYALYGDYETGLDKTRLSAFTRTFTGLKGAVKSSYVDFKGFGAHTEQVQAVDAMRGRGVSGYYYLSNAWIVEGSERVVIETRDRFMSGRILKRELKTRGVDYEVNYDLGAVLFKEPVPRFDEGFNPLFVVATYETDDAADKNYVYGGRAALRPLKWLETGATHVVEEHEAGDNVLQGVDAEIKLPFKTTFTAEYARSDALFDLDYSLEPKTGDGYSLRLDGEPVKDLDLSAYFTHISEFFHNPSAVDSPRGTRRYGFDASYRLSEKTSLMGSYFDEHDFIADTINRRASLGASRKFDKLTLKGDVLHEDSDAAYTPPSSSMFRHPTGYQNEALDDITSARLGAQYKLTDKLSLDGSCKRSISGAEHQILDGGASYQITKKTRAYLKEEYSVYPDNKDARTVLGAESQAAEDTVVYNEYRLLNGSDGRRNWSVMGLRNKHRFSDDLSGSLSLEYLSTVSGDRKDGQPDGFATTAGFAYNPNDEFKLTARLEFSNEESDASRKSTLGELGLSYAVNPDYTLLFRTRGFRDDLENDGDRTYARTMLGAAYRPVDYDAFNALAKMEHKRERDSMSEPVFNSDAWIPSVEFNYQWGRNLQTSAKYAGKFVRSDEDRAYTDLIQGRMVYDITDRFDVGGAYRILSSHDGGSVRQGGYAELGVRIVKDIWLSGGWCFDDFDSDLTGDSFEGKGPYIKLRFKFDENVFSRKRM